jgi:predicted HAD superfamily Cof-like phosphohydrolase
MGLNWVMDIEDMHDKFGVNEAVSKMDKNKLLQYLKFRINFIHEEATELFNAFENKDSEEIVDALIDICVVAIGTLDAFDVDAYEAWDSVHRANMAKEVGVKESRPNPLGLPDLIKPEGWEAPSHKDNHGLLTKTFD